MLHLVLHHPPRHLTAVWLLASASICMLFMTPKGPYGRGIAGRIAAWAWLLAGAAITAATAGFITTANAATMTAILAVIAAPLTAGELRASRRYRHACAADMPSPQSSRWWT